MAAKKMTALDLCVAELKKNKNVAYATIKAKADKKKIKIFPVNYGRAKAMLGLVKSAPRGKGKAAAAKQRAAAKKTAAGAPRRGRPVGSTASGSKSERIRELLGSGMTGAQIAKKVGCSVNLVYAVKSKGGSAPKRGGKRTATRGRRSEVTADGLNELISGLKEIQRERDDLRRALERIRAAVDSAL